MPVDGDGAVFTPDLPCGELGTCRLTMGIARPRSGGPWPVVVVVPGGPRPPDSDQHLGDFAGLVASQGVVVLVANYRAGPAWGGGFPSSYQDMACAVRFARENAAQWGGDGSRVTLVAHSYGAFVASVLALSVDAFTPNADACLTTTGSPIPDAFVGIAGVYSQEGVSTEFLDAFFGGTKEQQSVAWAAGDPYALVATRSNIGLPIRLVHGSMDTNVTPQTSVDFAQQLAAAGYRSDVTLVNRADHSGILQDHHAIEVVVEAALGLKP
jgi:acetyl esterase/lipase